MGREIVSIFTLNAVNRRFDNRADLHKNYIIGTCCFSAKHTPVRSKENVLIWNRSN